MSSLDRLRLHQARPFPEYLASLAEASATGVLKAASGDDVRQVCFVDGDICSASSSVEEERLGSWLVERSAITDTERALGLLAQEGAPARLGEVLRHKGHIDRSVLESELEQLTIAILRAAAAAPRTYCEFREGHDSPPATTVQGVTTHQLILYAAREFSDLDAMRTALGSMDQVCRPDRDLQTLLETVDLTPAEAFLLSRLDGSRPLGPAIAACSMGQDEAVATLYGLMLAGVLVQEEAGSHASAQPVFEPEPAAEPVAAVQPVDEGALTDVQRKERADITGLAHALPSMNHYQALRLDRSAKPNHIRDAWTSVQRQFNPRLAAQPHLRDLEEELEAITERAREAYDILSDGGSRQRYDQILRNIEEEGRLANRRPGQLGDTDPAVRREVVEANLKRVDELLDDGEVYLAIQLLEQACAFQPRPSDLVRLAQLLLRNPLWSNRALNTLKRAVEVDPACVDAWLELAGFWRKRKSAERERRALEHALAAEPDDPRAVKQYTKLAGRAELKKLQLRHQMRSS